jgi:hypothetical protein
MRSHRHRRVAQLTERSEIALSELGAARRYDRQLVVAVSARAAMARDMLDHRNNATLEQTFHHGPGECRDALGRLGVSPRSYHGMGLRICDVDHRSAIDCHADLPQVVRHEARGELGRDQRALAADFRRETRRSRISRPVRRTHPLHSAALLIYEHRRIVPPEQVAEGAGQSPQLLAVDDISLEEDETPWLRFT